MELDRDCNKHFLIIGSGSVGKRHAKNFFSLGVKISCFDPKHQRIDELAKEVKIYKGYTKLSEAFENNIYDGVVICSPTAYHALQAIESIRNNLPVLLEKPPAKTLNEAQEVARAVEVNKIPVVLGYTWRWWPPLERVYQLLQSNTIGKLLHVQFHMSAHLADWHPWEAYQSFFMASSEQGGGALLDESHWIDLMLWFFGKPNSVYGQVEKNSNLEINSDDNVDAIINYNNGLRVTLHLDLYGRPHEKFIRFIGEEGTIIWSVEPNNIKIGMQSSQEWNIENFSYDRNDMFMGVAREFLDVINKKTKPRCTINDGILVMEVVEAIRTSCKEERIVRLV